MGVLRNFVTLGFGGGKALSISGWRFVWVLRILKQAVHLVSVESNLMRWITSYSDVTLLWEEGSGGVVCMWLSRRVVHTNCYGLVFSSVVLSTVSFCRLCVGSHHRLWWITDIFAHFHIVMSQCVIDAGRITAAIIDIDDAGGHRRQMIRHCEIRVWRQ